MATQLGLAGQMMDISGEIEIAKITIGAKATVLGFMGVIVTIFAVDVRQAREIAREGEKLEIQSRGEPVYERGMAMFMQSERMLSFYKHLRCSTVILFILAFIGLILAAWSLVMDFVMLALFLGNWSYPVVTFVWNNVIFVSGLVLLMLALALRVVWST